MSPRIVFVWSFACQLMANQFHWHGKCGLIIQANENINRTSHVGLIFTGWHSFSWTIVFVSIGPEITVWHLGL